MELSKAVSRNHDGISPRQRSLLMKTDFAPDKEWEPNNSTLQYFKYVPDLNDKTLTPRGQAKAIARKFAQNKKWLAPGKELKNSNS